MWIETITLRSFQEIHDPLITELFKPVVNGGENNGLIAMKIYRNAWINTDVSIHLHWRSRVEEEGTVMGLALVQVLKEFGLVNHSAWVEEKGGVRNEIDKELGGEKPGSKGGEQDKFGKGADRRWFMMQEES